MGKVVLGIDLAGSSNRDSGVAVITGGHVVFVGVVRSDEEIMKLVKRFKPGLIAIDAPLTLPAGRRNIDEKCSAHFRECDMKLRERRIRFFPITIGPMRMLTKRGMALKRKIKGITVVEVFPGATYDVMGIPRKDKKKILRFFSKEISLDKRDYTQDELDGVCCAFTGKLILENRAVELSGKDGCIWLPKK